MIDKMIEELKEKMVLEFDQEVADILDLFSDVTIADFNIKTIEKRLCKKVFDEIAEKYKEQEFDEEFHEKPMHFTSEQKNWVKQFAKSRYDAGQNQKWNSVENGLPEEDGKYLCAVQFLDGVYYDLLWFTQDAYEKNSDDFYKYKGVKKGIFYKINSEWGDYEIDDVKAWMPIPKYKGGEK